MTSPQAGCVFCARPLERMVREEGSCRVILDGYPVSRGHSLIMPTRHVASFRDLTDEEWSAILHLAREQAAVLMQEDPTIDGFNLGINDGLSAGQSIFHVHVHLIPRRKGDVPFPRGGVRGILPGKADYPET